jgi:UDP-N-acetylglucosamine:LPS N-acetylglucosamine transferase
MDFFKFLYNLADLSIVHGLHSISTNSHNIICTNTIIRHEVTEIGELKGKNIYCILGGGTENVDFPFQESSIKIAWKCIDLAKVFQEQKVHILCSSTKISSEIENKQIPINVVLHPYIEDATTYYTDAKLIICRAGRNTISEVAYLGLPTIAFISGDRYRSSEQLDNAQSQNFKNIEIASCNGNLKEIAEKLITQGVVKNGYIPGNIKAINEILKLI